MKNQTLICGKRVSGRSGTLFVLFFLLTGIFFTSCDDWLDKGKNRYLSYGVVHEEADNKISITTDKGSVLHPTSRHGIREMEENDRLIVKFTIDDVLAKEPPTYSVDIYSVYKILTKDILPYAEEISDSLGLDPVRIDDGWIRNGFVTLQFVFQGGKPGLKHMINLVRHEEKPEDADVLLEFRHNAYEDPYVEKQYGVASFPVGGIFPGEAPEGKETLKVKIKYRGFRGTDRYATLTWRNIPAEETGEEMEKDILPEALQQEALF